MITIVILYNIYIYLYMYNIHIILWIIIITIYNIYIHALYTYIVCIINKKTHMYICTILFLFK